MPKQDKKLDVPHGTGPSRVEWAEDMQVYFRKHGVYRARDLDRLLGDPRSHVEVRVDEQKNLNVIVEDD